MNKARDKFIPKTHLKEARFTYRACEPFTKNKKRIQTFKETWDSLYTYQNKLDKACFQLDMDYRDFKYLFRRTFSDKLLRDKTFTTSKNSKNDEYQRQLIR